MKLSKSQIAVLALIIANIIWGTAPPIFKWALQEIHPYTLAFLRFAIPPLIMLPFVKNNLKIRKRDILWLIIASFFGITINISFFFQGLLKAPSINAALIGSSGPIFIILYSLVFLRKEKPRTKLILGSLIGLIGVLLVLFTPFFRDGKITAFGNFYYLIAMFGSVVSLLITRKIIKHNDPVAHTFWAFTIGAITFFPYFISEVNNYGFLPNIDFKGFIGITFGVLFSSLIAYYLHNLALKYLTAADVSVFTYIDPVVTILIAAPLLGEYPDTTFVAGSVLVILGILIAEGRLHYHPFHLFFKK